MSMDKKEGFIAAIIPCLNEETRIREVVRGVKKAGCRPIVVDDGSTDRTAAVALAAGATVLSHPIGLGKGGAMRTGTEYAIAEGADAILFLDGDGQHDPSEAVRFLEKLPKYDIILGARRKRLPFPRGIGRMLVSGAFDALYGIVVHDPLNGYRAFRAEHYPALAWKSDDYTVECEILANAGKAHLRSVEVPVKTIYHDKYKGVTPFDGFAILWNLLMWRVQRHKRKIQKG